MYDFKENYYALILAILSPVKKDENGNELYKKNGDPMYVYESAEDALMYMGININHEKEEA